nr:phage antirepressor KilAC domain-containing protein [Nostoc sp. ChiSLP03a]MDZ8215789.1 phage antirepressor KilAC domain-containing protein [Nostoc sp. ChiSLP03a]
MSNLTITLQSQIKATVESEVEFAVNFNDAWQWLEYSTKASAKRALISNFEEKVDYLVFNISVENLSGGRPSEEIYLTKDCFKQLAMLSGTAKGREVRLYFLQCEKELKAIREAQPKLPSNYREALLALVEAEDEKERLALKAAEAEAKVVQLQPKAEIFDVIAESGNLLSFSEAAKVINSPSLGRNNLMQLLRDKRVLQIGNLPYQQYVSQGYFEVVETVTNVGVKLTPKVTQKGLSFLIRFLQKEGYTVPSKAA